MRRDEKKTGRKKGQGKKNRTKKGQDGLGWVVHGLQIASAGVWGEKGDQSSEGGTFTIFGLKKISKGKREGQGKKRSKYV